jgi:hypothetical protein
MADSILLWESAAKNSSHRKTLLILGRDALPILLIDLIINHAHNIVVEESLSDHC